MMMETYNDIDSQDNRLNFHRLSKEYSDCTFSNSISATSDVVQIERSGTFCWLGYKREIDRFFISDIVSSRLVQGKSPALSMLMVLVFTLICILSIFTDNDGLKALILSIGLFGICTFVGTAIYFCCSGETCIIEFTIRGTPKVYWVKLLVHECNVVNDTLLPHLEIP
jgi:hypothetical protein